jgi:hypothetical protein
MQQEIKVNSDQSIFDVALFCYNDASLVYNLIDENPTITDISMDLTGLTLVYTPIKLIKYEARENSNKVQKVVTIKQQQNLFDLSLQHYGSIEFIYDLIQNNTFIDSILSNNLSSYVLANGWDKNYVNEFYVKGNIDLGTEEPKVSNFLLLEDGFYLLQENGYKIIL